MINNLFNNFLNTFIRNLSWDTRVGVAFAFFCFSLWCFKKSFRNKNELNPIKVGWLIMCLIAFFLSGIYIKL